MRLRFVLTGAVSLVILDGWLGFAFVQASMRLDLEHGDVFRWEVLTAASIFAFFTGSFGAVVGAIIGAVVDHLARQSG
jgi:hypothetical protein